MNHNFLRSKNIFYALFTLLLLLVSVIGMAQRNRFAPDPAIYNNQKNPFLVHTGKVIRSVYIKPIGVNGRINDTLHTAKGFTAGVAKALHKTTTVTVVENNLLFKAGDKLNPFLLSDNERFLREQVFFQDALIVVPTATADADSVDVEVLVKDVFSIGVGLGIGGTQKFKFELKEENIGGSGTKLAASTLIDDKRTPRTGFGAELVRRNIRGTFINWSLGFKNYANAFNSNRNEEQTFYAKFEKPLASQYLRWMGSLDIAYNQTSNCYVSDSLYKADFRYGYLLTDGWMAYNFGARKLQYRNTRNPVRAFIAVRAFHQSFHSVPDKSRTDYDGTYGNATGVLGSVSLYRQNYYRAAYIYGFGRNEDVPQGFSTSFIGGYTLRKDSLYNQSRVRPYWGAEASYSRYNSGGFYSAYTLRIGGYSYKSKWEDLDLLFNVEHFTKLKKANANWYRRLFINGGFAKQFKPVLEQPLLLRSQYGLPYFDFGYIDADMRATAKTEMVWYHTQKFLGFGFAPFVFGDFCLLKPTREAFSKSDLYSALGAGFRLRNESLILGTVELRASYFPRVLPGMSQFKIKINTNLRYRYQASFIRRPDFVTPN